MSETVVTAEKPAAVRVLVVEDDDLIRHSIQMMLELNGFSVLLARNGDEALSLLNTLESPPDVIVSDVFMPGINGFVFYQHLSRDSTWSDIPFIFISARADSTTWRTSKYLGAGDFLQKPFSGKLLVESIRERLSDRARREEFRKRFESRVKGHAVPGSRLAASLPRVGGVGVGAGAGKLERGITAPGASGGDAGVIVGNDAASDVVTVGGITGPDGNDNGCLILVFWDDKLGPFIKERYPETCNNPGLDIEGVAAQLYETSVGIYGQSTFTRPEDVHLRISNIGMEGYLFFDVLLDRNTRGGQSIFLIGFIAPRIHYLATRRMREVAVELAGKIKAREAFHVGDYFDRFASFLDTGHGRDGLPGGGGGESPGNGALYR